MNPVIRRSLVFLLFMCFFAPSVHAEEDAYIYPNEALSLRPGESFLISADASVWESDAPEVATGNGNQITAHDEGFAMLTAAFPDGSEHYYDITVSADAIPALIRAAVDLALDEWREYHGKTFTDRNKYTEWYCGRGPGCHFGWCGGFVSYCLDTAGVPMDDYTESVPHEGGVPYAVYAAGVGKLLTGYTKMERIGSIPCPGYLVIYGQRNRYNTIHVGMVTEARELEDGTWLVKTVEGNVSSRIKRYCYVYDPLNTNEHNYQDCPENLRTDDGIDQYTIHQKDWFIYTFCQTWY